MSKTEQPWVPMTQLAANMPLVDWRLNEYLSEYTPTNRLLVNPDRLSRLAMWGSFKPDVTVTGEEVPEARIKEPSGHDDETPTINGINADGTAVAGLSMNRQKKPEHGQPVVGNRVDEEGDAVDPQSDILSCRRVRLALHVDVPAIEADLTEKRALRDPSAWAGALDTALRQQTVQAAKEHLLGDAITKVLLAGPRLGALSCAFVFSETLNTPLGWQYAALESLPIFAAIAKKSGDIKQHGLRNPEKCYSLFWPQVDRIPATAMLARLPISRIVKPA